MKVIHTDNNGVAAKADESNESNGHRYSIEFPVEGDTPSILVLLFQEGPVKEVGVNGLTTEALLAILIHRTMVLNEKFPCPANLIAIDRMQRALVAFELRTADRIDRGVEGKNEA